MKKREKKKINLDKKNNSHFIKLNFDKTKNEKKFEKIKFIRKSSKNSDKIRSYKKINNTIGNISNHKYKKENKKNETKIELSKLFIKNFDKENYRLIFIFIFIQFTLNKSVKFIIIASSGVWRFMKEKEILNLGIKYYLVNDPDNFCNIIANKASELCKKNLGYIDDITIIVIFFTFI